MSYQPDEYIKKALKTWYPKDHDLHLNPLHPVIKLAGEAGEILDLYGKHKFKPGFDWWQCKHCRKDKTWHYGNELHCKDELLKFYTPLILDEIGDWWYYCRILMYLSEKNVSDFVHEPYLVNSKNELFYLDWINYYSAKTLRYLMDSEYIYDTFIYNAYRDFVNLLALLGVTLDELTEMNYIKLNSDATNHGWKGA